MSAEEPKALYISLGLAHGLWELSEEADFAYKVTAEHAWEMDAGILWNDPDIRVEWPFSEPILSPKDAQVPPVRETGVDFFCECDD